MSSLSCRYSLIIYKDNDETFSEIEKSLPEITCQEIVTFNSNISYLIKKKLLPCVLFWTANFNRNLTLKNFISI